MRRLHLQIFGALCAVGAVCVAATFLVAQLLGLHSQAPHLVRDLGAFIVADLPSAVDDPAHRELTKRARKLGGSISLWDAQGTLLARAGRPIPPPTEALRPGEELRVKGQTAWLALGDGRVLAFAYDRHPAQRAPERLLLPLGLALAVLVLGSYVAARRITRRLSRLERGVEAFGRGELEVRVDEQGRDEVARLARAFNRASARIAGLVAQQRRMLQSASHELRSPLARVRMAIELLADPDTAEAQRAELHAQAERDVEELDALIADLLLAERLNDSELPREFSRVALTDVAREECARVGAVCSAEPAELVGNARMLRSLTRNLLENARRYGKPPITLTLTRRGAELVLWVDDCGGGVAEADRERIFEPFYRPAGHSEGRDGGVGLGLALVRSVAQHHGGTVRYLARAPGSRFEVILPADAARGA
jgi:signal transduction histidine kinase